MEPTAGDGEASKGGKGGPRGRGPGILVSGLKAARHRRALSLSELERKSGVYRSTISELENLRRGAQPATVRRLAEALSVGVEELVGEEG